MRRRRAHGLAVALVGALIGAAALSGCTPWGAAGEPPQGPNLSEEDLAQARERWKAADMADYSYVLEGTCGEQQLVGRWAVRVAGGAVAEVASEIPDGWTPTAEQYEGIPTVPDLFDRLEASLAGDGNTHATFSPHWGHPMALVLDPMPAAVDDETCLTVTAVTPLEP
ncbi:DUF6174 domain-containing protein [Cellulomonas cellasea]|uniref:DUF6174 domain-containing protein n=1 Tax=Cellulomonas cellasea TaxID=43670 RepID=UPI0025A4927A|nr:DUF6174 domain-containing protein [Cellulomonas cellasea]MDM8084354.1 DUF6174 domain-containing protein [Cellulomonas cellasea]